MTDPARRLSPNVVALGLVSLAMGVSSAMVHGLLPVFLVTVLGASTGMIGLIEGIAEGTTSIIKVFSGAFSDRIRRRKPLVLLGYGLSACIKPVFPLAESAMTVLGARFADRLAKGIRDAPRDAFLADVTPPVIRGAGFGLRQALYTIGAVVGPLAAMALMAGSDGDFRLVFWVAVLPGLASVVVLFFLVDERPAEAEKRVPRRFRLSEVLALPPEFWRIVTFASLLALARFSPAFLMLKAHSVGLEPAMVPIAWVLMHAVYGAAAYPFGILADHLSPRLQLAFGVLCLVGAHLALAAAGSVELLAVGIVLWGLQMGVSQGLLAAMIANAAPDHMRGTAFGINDLATGLATVLANTGAGALWAIGGSAASFFAAAAVAAASAFALIPLKRGCQLPAA